MNGAKTLTHVLLPVFVGLVIGGAASGNISLLIWGVVLFILDVIVGITLQYLIDRAANNDYWNSLSFEEKRKVAHALVEKTKQDMKDEGVDVDGEIKRFCDLFNREHHLGEYSGENYDHDDDQSKEDELCDELDDIYSRLKADGGARLVNNIRSDEAGAFLLDVCEQMPHAPFPHTFVKLCAISVENLNGERSIVYSFRYAPNSMCQNVFIFLVHTKDEKIRLFTVETSLSKFMLCEYSGASHLNYGPVELKNVPTRIKEILKN